MAQSDATTWDGKPISADPPYGAAIIVYRKRGSELEFLILHRRAAADPGGDWAWTPPAGARFPDEPLDTCARRELLEETGLSFRISPASVGSDDWPVFVAEAPTDAHIALDDEHDEYAWASVAEAELRCLPEHVGRSIRSIADALAV